jgi:heme/copper-type cytochrome/quinol oxidase subunit 3
MRETILDEFQADENSYLSVYARGKASRSGTWMIISSCCALLTILITVVIIAEEGGWRYWRIEEISAEVFLICMAVKYVLLLIKGVRLRNAIRETAATGIESSARLYLVTWIFVGSLALIFMLAMFLYLTARVEVFGEISEGLFRPRKF